MGKHQIEFTTLSLRNFLSYGNNTTMVTFNNKGTTMIIGEDLDNTTNGQGANGVGKTVIINALAYALYDRPVSDISKDNLVNNVNKKHMVVTASFTKGNKTYFIERVRKMKVGAPGNWVKFLRKLNPGETTKSPVEINDEQYEDLSRSSKNTNEIIEKIIGIPYDLFCQIVVFSATKTPFLDLPVRHPQQTNQTSMIEELFGLTELSHKADIVKKNTKELSVELEKVQIRMEQIEREHIRHEEQVKTAKNRVLRWESDNLHNIQKLKNDLSSTENVDVETERELHSQLKEQQAMKSKISADIQSHNRELKEQTKAMKDITNEWKHLKDDVCPYCLQDFKEAQLKISKLEQMLEDCDRKVSSLTSVLLTLDEESISIDDKINLLESQITTTNLEDLIEIKAQSHQIALKIAEMELANNPFIEPLEDLESLELDNIDYSEINKIRKTIDHEKFLVKLLTKRDSFVRKVLLNKNLPFLNRRLAKYLNQLGLPHKVEFNGELVAEITRFGRPLDFGNLSNGQRARVNLALSFAFRDVLQKLHTPINVCLMDEVLDVGLDAIGVQAAAKMIKQMARDEKTSVYIISHREELDSAFDRTMVVQMSKGFSYIKEEI